MDYSYLDQGDERLLQLCDLPTGKGIAVALRATGFDTTGDEIVELAIVDLDGKELLAKRVKPQNREEWSPGQASGGIAPQHVGECPELFQFEDDIRDAFDKADVVVFEHRDFAVSLLEASWIALPDFVGFDLNGEFCHAHCASDYPGEPAAAVALDDIARYYALEQTAADPVDPADEAASLAALAHQARLVGACYRAFVREHASQRDAKGSAHWEERDRRLAEEAAADAGKDAVARMREHRLNQMNGLLWIAGAIIFTSVVIQLNQNGGEASLMVMAGAVAVFCLVRGVVNFRK